MPPDQVTINGERCYLADALVFDFQNEMMMRPVDGPHDPPEDLIRSVIDRWISRFRYVCAASDVRSPEFPQCTWKLTYLDDEGGQLPKQEGHLRVRTGHRSTFTVHGVDPNVWKAVNENLTSESVPVWETLRLDAIAALPHVGTSVVLGAAALEVFVANTLDRLAKGNVSAPLWEWINGRKDHTKAPTVEEQYDALLKEMCGHSLKEERELWNSFLKLKTARNRFVHTGMLLVHGEVIDQAEASRLLAEVLKIVRAVMAWIPEDQRWPQFKFEMNIEVTKLVNHPVSVDASGSLPYPVATSRNF